MRGRIKTQLCQRNDTVILCLTNIQKLALNFERRDGKYFFKEKKKTNNNQHSFDRVRQHDG